MRPNLTYPDGVTVLNQIPVTEETARTVYDTSIIFIDEPGLKLGKHNLT